MYFPDTKFQLLTSQPLCGAFVTAQDWQIFGWWPFIWCKLWYDFIFYVIGYWLLYYVIIIVKMIIAYNSLCLYTNTQKLLVNTQNFII